MRFTLSAFTSFVILLFIICLYSCVIYIVENNFLILLFNNFDSILNSSPKGCKTCFGLIFGIEWEEPCTTDYTMIESSLILSPKHSSKGSFHRFGFNEELLMRWKIEFLGLVWNLSNKVIDQMRPHDRSI